MARNKLLVPDAKKAIEALKNEIAQEFGIMLGADTSSRLNGTVGGEMVKRLVKMAQEQLSSGYTDKFNK
ncbi:MAG: alpha/beta-type small acid-soluble spore protein [Bacilli bacterium]|nr:alpha/beta-type small acid-soluble spore protein [Bacilli bacterium]